MTEEVKHLLTEEGLRKTQEEYNHLVHVVREEVTFPKMRTMMLPVTSSHR